MEAWPHQLQGVRDVLAAIASGQRRLALTSPTGGGKSLIMQLLARHNLEQRLPVALFTNRRLLIDQLSDGLADAGFSHGVRHRDYDDDMKDHPFQICSLQTENTRVLKRGTWDLHAACPGGLVLVDEGHLHTTGAAKAILEVYHQKGAAYVLFTATPLGLSGVADRLIIAGTVSELRECGALVPAIHYGPDEPDLRSLRKLKVREGDDLSERQAALAMGPRPELWGRVSTWFERLNPEHKPAILFGPDVAGSLWFAEQFSAHGLPAAHIDGEHCWTPWGGLQPTTRDLREEIFDGSRAGRVSVLCNRFVLREGLDLPHLEVAVLATIFGGLQTYLQAGGRILRASPGTGKTQAIVIDHAGNWWRHGSLNADREWRLEYTASMAYGLRADDLRNSPSKQPGRCPKCTAIIYGRKCMRCGWEAKLGEKRSRTVVMTDGSLRELSGEVFRPHRITNRPDGKARWERMYWRSIRRQIKKKDGSLAWVGKDRTFREAIGLFCLENNWGYPDPTWPFMPLDPMDAWRLVGDVPMSALVPKEVMSDA